MTDDAPQPLHADLGPFVAKINAAARDLAAVSESYTFPPRWADVCRNCGREVEPDGDEWGHVAAALPDDDPRAIEFWGDVCPDPEPR